MRAPARTVVQQQVSSDLGNDLWGRGNDRVTEQAMLQVNGFCRIAAQRTAGRILGSDRPFQFPNLWIAPHGTVRGDPCSRWLAESVTPAKQTWVTAAASWLA
nr:hypothetical protein KPHV_58670 [Kitasatospora purpeofusca]